MMACENLRSRAPRSVRSYWILRCRWSDVYIFVFCVYVHILYVYIEQSDLLSVYAVTCIDGRGSVPRALRVAGRARGRGGARGRKTDGTGTAGRLGGKRWRRLARCHGASSDFTLGL